MGKFEISEKRRVKAEGVLIALETLAVAAMDADKSLRRASKSSPIVASIEHSDKDGYKISNFPAIVFSLTHPWVEIHTTAAQCDSSKEQHEMEYGHMIDTLELILKDRLESKKLVDGGDDDGDEDEEED